MPVQDPDMVIIISGKRKSGKDYFADLLTKKTFPGISTILRLSAPLKRAYADIHKLDYDKLLGTSSYKETYRKDMIKWGEEQRNKDPGIFCRLATVAASQPVWIISDARRKSDLVYFQAKYGIKTVLIRIMCDDGTRLKRGWHFTPGVDDVDSECALDDIADWDYVVQNDGTVCENSPSAVASQLEKHYNTLKQQG